MMLGEIMQDSCKKFARNVQKSGKFCKTMKDSCRIMKTSCKICAIFLPGHASFLNDLARSCKIHVRLLPDYTKFM